MLTNEFGTAYMTTLGREFVQDSAGYYEENHESHREFFRIANMEADQERRNEIEKLMLSPYGVKIEQWLKKIES